MWTVIWLVLTRRPSETCRPISHLFSPSLSPPRRSADLSHLLVALCVLVCVPLPPTAPITLTTTADPNRTDLGRPRQPSIHRLPVFREAFLSLGLASHGFRPCVSARVSPTVEGTRARVKSSEGDTLCLVPR